MRRFLTTLVFPFGLALVLGNCHDCNGDDVGHGGDLVGGGCFDDHDCVHRCVRGGDYPGGTCTVNCRDDRDCPDGTWCIDKSGGVCLLGCNAHHDCRSGYGCFDTDREGHGGDIPVCIND